MNAMTETALEQDLGLTRRWGQVVARAWDDEDFRQRLLAQPEDVLREEGFGLRDGVRVRIVEAETELTPAGMTRLHLPTRPAADDLIEDALSLPDESPWVNCGPCKHCQGKQCLCLACSDCACDCFRG